jgi:hypothetical protein
MNSGAPSSQENEQKLGILLRLGSHFWPNDFTPSQAKQFLADYLEDLAGAPVAEVDIVCRNWRRNAAHKHFPRCGELLKALRDNQRDLAPDRITRPEFGARITESNGRETWESRPCMWWMRPKQLWRPDWKESEVPMGQMIRDDIGGPLRQPRQANHNGGEAMAA